MSFQKKIIFLVSLVCCLAMPSQTIAYAGDPWYQNYMLTLMVTPCAVAGVGYEVRKAYKKANKEYQNKLTSTGSETLLSLKPNLSIKEFMLSKDFPQIAVGAGALAILAALACGKVAANAKKISGANNRGGASSSGRPSSGAAPKQKIEDPSIAAWRKQQEEKRNKRVELAQALPEEFSAKPLLTQGADLFTDFMYPTDEENDFCGDLLQCIGENSSWDQPSFDTDMEMFKAYGESHLRDGDSASIEQKSKCKIFNDFFQALPDLKRCPQKRNFVLQQKTGDERNGSTEKTVGFICDAQEALIAIQKSRSEWANDSAGYSGASGIRTYYQWDDATSTWKPIGIKEYYDLKKK